MTPQIILDIEEAFAARQHVTLALNTEDRFYYPDQHIGPSNLNYFLAAYFSSQGYRILQMSQSTGCRELNVADGTVRPVEDLAGIEAPGEMLQRIGTLMKQHAQPWLVLLLHAERLCMGSDNGAVRYPDPEFCAEQLHLMALNDDIASGPSRLVLITYQGLPDDLLVRSRGFRLVHVGLPGLEERSAFIDFMEQVSEEQSSEFGIREADLSRETFALTAAGMPLTAIESLYRQAAHFQTPISRKRIRVEKARAIRHLGRDLLEVTEPEHGFEIVAGLDSIKDYLIELIPQIRSGRPGVPQSIMLQGVPGCGKSHIVKALSKELGWPMVELRSVRSPFVGKSESNLEHVIRIVEQLAPVILFFDEIDQSLGQRNTGVSGDSGTSERMLARLFSWLGSLHLRGRVLFVGATNRPDALDPALLDRFGVSIPFLKPGSVEIREMIPLLLDQFQRKMRSITPDEAACKLYDLQPTGRRLQEIIIEAGLHADRRQHTVGSDIADTDLASAVKNQIPREDETELEYIALIALSLTSSQSLLPWNRADGLRSGASIPAFLLEGGIVSENGRLDKTQLCRRINELNRQRSAQWWNRRM